MRTTKLASMMFKSAILVGLAVSAPLSSAGEDSNQRSSVNAAFGRGLNTASPPTNPVNHAVLPKVIRVKAGGVVDFAVAGFHEIVIFKPGVTLDDLLDGAGQIPLYPPVFVIPPDPATPLPAVAEFLEDLIYYRGINPAGGPLATAPVVNPSNAMNRGEPVSFLEAGTYLVICNVRPHLLNGMFGYVKVSE